MVGLPKTMNLQKRKTHQRAVNLLQIVFGVIIHAFTLAIVHACIMAIVHACTMIIVHACIMIIVHACTMSIVHAFTMIMVHFCRGSGGRGPPVMQGGLRGGAPPNSKIKKLCAQGF